MMMIIAKPGMVIHQNVDWEQLWSLYDETTYQSVLQSIHPDDIVLDIGAGDFRLAQRMALIARKIYAVEVQWGLFPHEPIAQNLVMIHADARYFLFPEGITVGVLLMRHCRHFRLYADHLKVAGAKRMITNARWGMGVELIDLDQKREQYAEIELGWYACWCGRTGFKPGPAELLTAAVDREIHEVVDCPNCQSIGV